MCSLQPTIFLEIIDNTQKINYQLSSKGSSFPDELSLTGLVLIVPSANRHPSVPLTSPNLVSLLFTSLWVLYNIKLFLPVPFLFYDDFYLPYKNYERLICLSYDILIEKLNKYRTSQFFMFFFSIRISLPHQKSLSPILSTVDPKKAFKLVLFKIPFKEFS